MDLSNIFVILYISGTILSFLQEIILEQIDFAFRKKHGTEIPEILKDFVKKETLERACSYKNAKYRFWVPSTVLQLILGFYLWFSGFYPAVVGYISSWTSNAFFMAVLFAAIISIPTSILSIPFDLYSEFVVEKHFGFSKMTLGTWIADQIKGTLVSLIIFSPLLLAVTGIFKYCGNWWWIMLGCIYLIYSVTLSIIYPLFIAPLFNKFKPLEDGELKTRLELLLKKCGFKSSGLYVMDASRRSRHSNAYFTGFGKSKRVVLYDTLIQQLSVEEIEAVLSHELGHYKHHHIVKRLFVVIPLVFAILYGISFFVNLPYIYEGFGFKVGDSISYQMMFFGLWILLACFGGWFSFMNPISNYFSRRDEFQADAYAKKLCGSGEPLISSLIKLNKENLSEIQVPKIYSAFNYSHPPLLERIKALK